MKKLILITLTIFLIFTFSVKQLNAQDIGMNFYLNFGILTDDSFTFNDWLWSAGAQLDFHLGSVFMLTPECDIIIYKFDFDPVILAPAVLLNVKLSNFFIGAGLTKWFLIGDSVGTIEGEFALKMNAGIRTSNLKLTIYAISYFDNIFNNMIIGFNLGFGF